MSAWYPVTVVGILVVSQQLQELRSMREALEQRQEEMMRRLKQQYQEEVDQLKAKVRSAEDTERRWEARNQVVLVQMEEEVKQVNEKLHNASQVIGKLQVSAQGIYKVYPFNYALSCVTVILCVCFPPQYTPVQTKAEGLTGQITTLRTELAEAREENDARKMNEVKLQVISVLL